jgi:hypothetical protein
VTQYLLSLLSNNTFVIVRLVPGLFTRSLYFLPPEGCQILSFVLNSLTSGINLYAILVYDTVWWWICSMIMILMFIALFLFTLYKFVQVVLHRGWHLTVLHVLILLHAAAALGQIKTFVFPLLYIFLLKHLDKCFLFFSFPLYLSQTSCLFEKLHFNQLFWRIFFDFE